MAAGVIRYDGTQTDPLTLLDTVNAIGKFKATIVSVAGVQVQTTLINIQGMTCMSCVNNITGEWMELLVSNYGVQL